ncbi:MAG TPA: phage portal protein, partial [Solirubrobacteraceae bacterium]|nr:phage portal protein [Solirubrobacteraceae bacterium]
QGFSPLRAAYELAEIWDKRTDYEDSVLTNRARPDALLIPKDDLISPEEIQRANQEFKQQFGLSGAGGLWIPPGGLTFQAVSYPPKDMGELALSKETKINLASVFDIPAELVDQQAPRAAKDAALLDYARNGVKPRCMRLQECLNSNFVNRFDERLFLAYDDPVPADVKAQTEKHGKLVAGGIETRNEARAEFGLPPLEGGDTLLVAANLIPLQHAASGDPRLIEPEGAARPEEIPDEDRTPSKEDGDDDHDADVDESDDEPFEEGDDVASAKGLGDEYRFPFDEDGDIPSAERILRRALRDAGYSLAEHENETLAGVERLRLVRSVSTVAERWLRREATKVLKAAGVKGIAADMIDKVNGFFRRAGRFVRNAVTAGALAILGPGPLSDEERRAAEQQAFRQLSFLERFRDETAGGQKPIDRRFRQRAGLYGQAVRGTAQNVMRQTVQAIVVEEMRLHYKELEAHHPCQTCIGVSGYWAPVGELPEIGDSECQAMCDCYFVYRGLDNEEFTAGRPRLSAQGRGPLYEPVFGER